LRRSVVTTKHRPWLETTKEFCKAYFDSLTKKCLGNGHDNELFWS